MLLNVIAAVKIVGVLTLGRETNRFVQMNAIVDELGLFLSSMQCECRLFQALFADLSTTCTDDDSQVRGATGLVADGVEELDSSDCSSLNDPNVDHSLEQRSASPSSMGSAMRRYLDEITPYLPWLQKTAERWAHSDDTIDSHKRCRIYVGNLIGYRKLSVDMPTTAMERVLRRVCGDREKHVRLLARLVAESAPAGTSPESDCQSWPRCAYRNNEWIEPLAAVSSGNYGGLQNVFCGNYRR